MGNLKYENLVHRFEPEYAAESSGGAEGKIDSQIYFRGASQIPGSEFNIGYGLVTKAGVIDIAPHKHQSDEYLVFAAGSLNSKDWDAYAEITIGIGEDAEVYSIDEPMTIYIPAGLWHGPLDFKRLEKPVWFQSALFQSMFGGAYALPDGEKELYYNGPINCVLGEDKKCDCCKKCLSRSWEN